jgi:hypothetical protein
MEQLFEQGDCDVLIRGAGSLAHLKETLRTLNVLMVIYAKCASFEISSY